MAIIYFLWQHHRTIKLRDNGDKGPNTGGMGAYSPAPVVSDLVYKNAMEKVIKPTVDAHEK